MTSDLDIVLQQLIEHAKAIKPVRWREELRIFRARARVTLQQLEEPEPLVPNKLTDRNNIRSRTFYGDAIGRLSLMMGEKSPVKCTLIASGRSRDDETWAVR